MPITTKQFFWSVVGFLFYFALMYWLVGGSIWLDIVMAIALVEIGLLQSTVSANRRLSDRADAELVQVSAIARPAEEKMVNFEAKFVELGGALEDLKRNTVDSGHHFNEKMALYISKRISDCEDRIKALEKRLSHQDTPRPT